MYPHQVYLWRKKGDASSDTILGHSDYYIHPTQHRLADFHVNATMLSTRTFGNVVIQGFMSSGVTNIVIGIAIIVALVHRIKCSRRRDVLQLN